MPVPFFMNVFQPGETPILPKHAFDGIDVSTAAGVRGAEIMQKPIGTGPFRLKEWRKGSHIILEKNADYWDKGRPCLDQVVLRVLPDGAARAIAVETGEVDLAPMSGLPEAEIQRLSKLPQIVTSQDGAEALGPNMWLEVNMREKPLADVKVRQAISVALDRAKIVDVIWYGQGTPADGSDRQRQSHVLQQVAQALRIQTSKKANALLDEAGYKRGAGRRALQDDAELPALRRELACGSPNTSARNSARSALRSRRRASISAAG